MNSNTNNKTFENNPNLIWSKNDDDDDDGNPMGDDNDLPKWAVIALKSSPIRDSGEQRSLPSPSSDSFFHHSVEEGFPSGPVPPQISPRHHHQHHQQQISPQDDHQHQSALNRQKSISNQNFHQNKSPQTKPHPEFSTFPTGNMLNPTMESRHFYNNPYDNKHTNDPTNRHNNIATFNNKSINNNFQNEFPYNNNNNGYFHNTSPPDDFYNCNVHPTNIFMSTNFRNNYGDNHNLNNMDNNTSSDYYQQHQGYQVRDRVMYAQSKPVMSAQPQASRMYPHQYQSISHQYQSAYPYHGGMTSNYIPISLQHHHHHQQQQHQSRRDFQLGSNFQKVQAFNSIDFNRSFNNNSIELMQGFLSNDDENVSSHFIPIQICKNEDSINDDSSTTSPQKQSKTNETEPDEDSSKQNEMKIPVSEIKTFKDPPNCETGKPNLPAPRDSPKSTHKDPPKPETTTTPATTPATTTPEKDERSPVAYTILFSSKEEVSKPPELSDRRPFSRAKSQDRSAILNKLNENKKSFTRMSMRGVSAKQGTSSLSTQAKLPPETLKTPRRSRTSVKSSSEINHQPINHQPINQQSINQQPINHRSINHQSPNQSTIAEPEKLDNKNKPDRKAPLAKIDGDQSGDDVSESGTYVIDSEFSLAKSFRDDIPSVFGIDVGDLDDDTFSFKRRYSEKAKNHKKSLGNSADFFAQTKKLRDYSLENNFSAPDKFSSRRLLPDAPAVTPEKNVIKKKPSGNDSMDSVTKWLNKSPLITNKPPPSTNNIYSTRSNNDDILDFHQSRTKDRPNKVTQQSSLPQKELPKRDTTPFREISGRRSVDPNTTSVKSRVARMNKISNFCDGEDASSSSIQMSKSLISSFDFHSSPLLTRPTRPRSTSRPRLSRGVSGANVTKKMNDLSIESLTESKADVDSQKSARQQAVSERLCAPTIATEMKSKKILTARESTPSLLAQNGSHETSMKGLKKRISRSKTLDCDSALNCSNPNTDDDAESNKSPNVEITSNMSQKVARLTEKFVKDTEELLKDVGEIDSPDNSELDEMLIQLKGRQFSNVKILTAVSNLLKLQAHSNEKPFKASSAKKYRETTF